MVYTFIDHSSRPISAQKNYSFFVKLLVNYYPHCSRQKLFPPQRSAMAPMGYFVALIIYTFHHLRFSLTTTQFLGTIASQNIAYRSPPISAQKLPSYCKIIDFLCDEMFPAPSSAMIPMCYLIRLYLLSGCFLYVFFHHLQFVGFSKRQLLRQHRRCFLGCLLEFPLLPDHIFSYMSLRHSSGYHRSRSRHLQLPGLWWRHSVRTGRGVMSWLALRVLIFSLSKPS